ncbi:MAG: hypothetical protein ACRC23_21415 [Aeromonas jandaei]
MDEIINELAKPVWWVSVVIAGIAINLFSSYLKSLLDRTIAKTSSWWRSKSDARQKAWKRQVELLSASEDARNAASWLEIRSRLQSMHLLLLAIFLLLLPILLASALTPLPRLAAIAAFAFATFIFFMSYLAFLRAVSTRNALREAASKANPSINTDAA